MQLVSYQGKKIAHLPQGLRGGKQNETSLDNCHGTGISNGMADHKMRLLTR
jgi:hypothetical protein